MESHNRLPPEFLLSAFVNRKRDIIYPNMKLMPLDSPGWYLLSADLGNKYSVDTLYEMAAERDIFKVLIAEKNDLEHRSFLPKKRLRSKTPHASADNKRLAVTSMENIVGPPQLKPGNIEDYDGLPTRREQLVLPEGYPRSDILIHEQSSSHESTEVKKTTRKKNKGNTKVERSIVVNEILSRSDEILQPNFALRKRNDPVWQEITNALGKKLQPGRIFDIAAQETKVHALIKSKQAGITDSSKNHKTSLSLPKNKKNNLDAPILELHVSPTNEVPESNAKKQKKIYMDRSIVINEILSRGDKILRPDGLYHGATGSIWVQISNALGNAIKPGTVYSIAKKHKVRDMITNNKKKVDMTDSSKNVEASENIINTSMENQRTPPELQPRKIAATQIPTRNAKVILLNDYSKNDRLMRDKPWTYAPLEDRESEKNTVVKENGDPKEKTRSIGIDDDEESRERAKLYHEMTINAIVARRDEIINAEGRYVSEDHGVWRRIAQDLGKVVSPAKVYDVACRPNVRALVRHEYVINNTSRVREVGNNAIEENLRDIFEQFVCKIACGKVPGKEIEPRDDVTDKIKRLEKEIEKMKEEKREEQRRISRREAIQIDIKCEEGVLGTEKKPICLD